jgi:TRAP-type C4-dicarboxylate transport system permease small subunit
VFLDVAGVIFLILIVFAGYRWMTAGGNEEGVTKAKETLQRAVIGLAIVLFAYAMSIFIINSLIVSTVTIKAGP